MVSVSYLKNLRLPNLVMIQCVGHSLLLALSHSVPRNIDYMVRETYNWLGHSSKRQNLYKQLYKALNDGKQPLQFSRVSDTRWTSMEQL